MMPIFSQLLTLFSPLTETSILSHQAIDTGTFDSELLPHLSYSLFHVLHLYMSSEQSPLQALGGILSTTIPLASSNPLATPPSAPLCTHHLVCFVTCRSPHSWTRPRCCSRAATLVMVQIESCRLTDVFLAPLQACRGSSRFIVVPSTPFACLREEPVFAICF